MRTEEVHVVVRRRGDFLVLHRSPRQGAYWHGVAGGVEDGESPLQAAARELAEETGLVAEPVDLDRSHAYGSVTIRFFVVEAPAGWEPTLDWEHDGYRWCPAREADGLLRWPDVREVVRELAP